LDFTGFLNSDIYAWVLLPLFIFLARIIDVSIGTVRIIFISKGFKLIAPLLGFFEVIIWLLAIRQIMTNLTNVMAYIAYGAGFAAGTFIGMMIEEKLSIGKVLLRIITKKDCSELLKNLKSKNYHVTDVEGEGNDGKVKIIYLIIERHEVKKAIEIVKEFNPNAFYSIEDVRFAVDNEGGDRRTRKHFSLRNILRFYKIGK